jgi:hypothetical protein
VAQPIAAVSEDVVVEGVLTAYERGLILAALAAVGGRRRSAAELLRTPPTVLSDDMRRLGIRPQRAARRLVPVAGTRVSDSLHWSGALRAGGVVAVRGLNGPVRVEAACDERVEVNVVRTGPRALIGVLALRVVEHAGGLTVCTVWQGLEPMASRRRERRACRGLAELRMEIVVRVPHATRVVASTFGGDVEVIGLLSLVEAAAANGRVRFLSGAPAPAHETA